MTDTPTPRQLPGVKGQWILCLECPPTKMDADGDGEVRIFYDDLNLSDYLEYDRVDHDQYWRPMDKNDPRPFTLPTEPTPVQPAAVARKYKKLYPNLEHKAAFAIADDNSAWFLECNNGQWSTEQLPSLPDREVG